MTLPREFRSRITSHNRHATAAVVLCLFGSCLSWALAYAIFTGLLLSFLTMVHNLQSEAATSDMDLSWIHLAVIPFVALLLTWGAIDSWCRRFCPVNDRQIVGWHILGDVLLAPSRLTFGIWGHLRAIIHLNEAEKCEAFELLRHIHDKRRCSLVSMGSFFSESARLPKHLEALQLVGWIGLLRHNNEWCYVIPGTEEAAVADLMNAANNP